MKKEETQPQPDTLWLVALAIASNFNCELLVRSYRLNQKAPPLKPFLDSCAE
jgi:hypothetical protein